jgi:hypothetical protein
LNPVQQRPGTGMMRPQSAQLSRSAMSQGGIREGVLSSEVREVMRKPSSSLSLCSGSTGVAEVLDLEDEAGGEDGIFKLLMTPIGGKSSTSAFLAPLNLKRERTKVSPG